LNTHSSLNVLEVFLVMFWLAEGYHRRVLPFCSVTNAMVLPSWQYLSVWFCCGDFAEIVSKEHIGG